MDPSLTQWMLFYALKGVRVLESQPLRIDALDEFKRLFSMRPQAFFAFEKLKEDVMARPDMALSEFVERLMAIDQLLEPR